MIIIPEIETVVILVPRTGTSSLRRAIAAKYPLSMQIYRHMEADGLPLGYDRWRRVGVVRHPVDRLWSLYKFLTEFRGPHDRSYIAAMRESVDRPFTEWLVKNEVVFTSPYDRANQGRYFPQYAVRHALPENRKSQWLYLRPDLGTEVYRYDDLAALAERLGVRLQRHNATAEQIRPGLTPEAAGYVRQVFKWDLAASAVPSCEVAP